MPLSQVNGVELYWERAGDGPPLLFCNGSGSTLNDARQTLDGLAAGFELLAWDYRGLGLSAAAPAPYEMADLAADINGLLDLAGWEQCRVLGVSFGGMVAQELAVTSPERVERLALACTSSGGAGGSSYPLQDLLALPAQERAAVGLQLADSRWDERWLAAHPADRLLAERIAATRAGQDDSAPAHALQMRARHGHDVWDRLSVVDCPTLVASGRYDGIAPPQNGRAIASRIHGADFREYEGGHMFMFQDPAAGHDLAGFLRAEGGP